VVALHANNRERDPPQQAHESRADRAPAIDFVLGFD
jgi:hypothetical protein